MALDATVGGTTANSYVTRARGLELMAQRLYTSAFDALSVDDKDKAFMMATRLLDSTVCIIYSPATATQALRFPVTGAELYGYTIANDVIPYPIEDATVELARLLATNDYSAPTDAQVQGLTKVKVSTIELGFSSMMTAKAVPDLVTSRLPKAWICPTAEEELAASNRVAEFRML